MDTSETYVKMCEKAEEIQVGHKFQLGDYYKYHSGWCVEAIGVYHGDDIEVENLGNNSASPQARCPKGHIQYLWLPCQDQLQAMAFSYWDEIGNDNYTLHTFFNDFIEWDYRHNEYPCEIFKSFDQLWLAFVMKEKYNKVWNGEDWQ